jgi:hypothetical protein
MIAGAFASTDQRDSCGDIEMKPILLAATAAAALLATPAAAQMTHDMGQHDGHMPEPSPAPEPMAHMHHMATASPGFAQGSGTSRLPANEGMMPSLHVQAGDWMLMAHGTLWGVATDQGGPRGDDMAFVESMAMLTGAREFGHARLQLRSMLSLEPLMGAEGYPNLFATGETANGAPLIDRQHPHDLFMELAARVDVPVGGGNSVFLYGGPVAEPALGPSAFMHRGSARYAPLAPVTHHWFDSTHITYGVVTAGWSSPRVQLEASAFRGREPDEERWGIESPKLDSWSARATWTPSPAWVIELSHGRLESPEALHGQEDEARTVASVHYAKGGLATTFAVSAKNRLPGPSLTAWLAEANWDIDWHHTLFGRIENVANDELFPDEASPLHHRSFRVTKAELGYAYRLPVGPLELALGGTVAAYAKPQTLDAAYGRSPVSTTLFAKLSLGH